ncbi:hypothetical protein ACQKKX_10210 [Neorhizobium sp. NPDC001467]|uniref:hypothetical protein n=1 Tax=Neorhizobium sp. NPDC001467 TaxID=3390595 RepID=UPI003D04EE77
MTRSSTAIYVMLGAAIAALPASTSLAQDAFQNFKQLGGSTKMPKLNAFSATPAAPAGILARNVAFEAKLTSDGETMKDGLAWRVFGPIPGDDGKLPLLASADGGTADFQLVPGDYFVNVAFGRAGVTRKLTVPTEGQVPKQTVVLDAGGFVLNAVTGTDVRIPPSQLSFSVYSAEPREDGERGLVIADVKANSIVRLNAGTYHVVSEYGGVNAVARADIQIEAGKLTTATLQHRAAQITLKLVSQPGGEAIADTAWSVLTASGDVVNESVSAFSTMVLSEGDYLAVARNKDKVFQREFTVKSGENADVDVLLSSQAQTANADIE